MMEIRNLFHKGGSLADLRYKEKERKKQILRNGQKTAREEYTLDGSQSKVFLFTFYLDVWRYVVLIPMFMNFLLLDNDNMHVGRTHPVL